MKKTANSIAILFLLLAALSNNIYSQNTCITYKRLYVDRDTEIKDGTAVTETIRVRKGATLTVNCKLSMGQNAKLIVERGGKLIIEGEGVLTNAEEDKPWDGILVYGQANKPQENTYQGRVEVVNGGTIENAVCGISTIAYTLPNNPGDNLFPNYDYTGGMVLCNGAVFKNNGTAVKFWDYGFENSKSLFGNCQFITSGELLAGIDPGYFIEMDGIDGIQVGGCSFADTRSVPVTERTSGILAQGSKASVFGSSGFTGLYYGIKALAHGPGKYIKVKDTDFTDNFRGMYIGGMSNAVITDNNFEIKTPYSSLNGGYGLYLDRSTGYKVEGNNFFSTPFDLKGVGLVVNQSGGNPNEIYRNYFSYLECGMDIQGVNRDLAGNGLVLKCNQYEETLMDKIITEDQAAIRGIAHSQGAPTSNPEDMAGNLFYIPSPTPSGDYDDILNEGNHITYYYPLNYEIGYDNVIPVDYTQSTVKIKAVGGFNWSFENGCPPSEEPSGGGIGDTKGKMASAGQKADSTEMLLAMLIDGGNTEAVQTDVGNSVPPETMQVYNELMAKSPYLSDTVISTAIEKEDVLPGAMIRDIMVANPKAAKSEKLMDKLDQRWDPLPEYMKAQILAGRSIVSIREETESRLAAFKLKRAKHFNTLARYYLNDTSDPIGSMDSLVALLDNENSLSAKYGLAFLNGELGEWNMGLEVINDIPVQFGLNAQEANAHAQMAAYYNLLSGLAQEGKSILEADSSQIATLFDMEESSSGMASIYARNILLALNEIEYDEPILMPDALKSSAVEESYEELLGKAGEAPGHISVMPNPARDYVIIAYDLEKTVGAIAEIRNMGSKLKYSRVLENKKDQLTINTRKWNPGIYILSLKIDGKLVESLKFTVID